MINQIIKKELSQKEKSENHQITKKKHSQLISQIIKFGIIGIIGVSFNYSIFFILYKFFNIFYIISSATGFGLGIILVFFLNKKFTFKIKNSNKIKGMFVKYFLLNALLALFGLLLLSFFVEILYINAYIGNALVIFIIASMHFIGSKFLVFIEKNDPEILRTVNSGSSI